MRIFRLAVLFVFALTVYAQRHAVIVDPGAYPSGAYGSHSGFGNVVFPGTGGPPPVGSGFGNVVFPGTGGPPPVGYHPFSITDPGFANRLGGVVSGFGPYTGAPPGGLRWRPRRPMYVPVAYPVYVGGYYPEYPQYPQQPANVTVVNEAPPPAQIIINNYAAPREARPVAQEYGPDSWKESGGVGVYQAPTAKSEEPQENGSKATVYLIAFKDGAIYPALAWWLEDDTLQYITTQGKPNKASLTLIDRGFSERLNRERGIEFQLPAF